MCCGDYPSSAGYVIASLKPGDEISVKQGFGNPAIKDEKKLVVARVDGFSAVCTDGTRLRCNDGWGIEATGNKKPVSFLTKALTFILPRQSANILCYLSKNTG